MHVLLSGSRPAWCPWGRAPRWGRAPQRDWCPCRPVRCRGRLSGVTSGGPVRCRGLLRQGWCLLRPVRRRGGWAPRWRRAGPFGLAGVGWAPGWAASGVGPFGLAGVRVGSPAGVACGVGPFGLAGRLGSRRRVRRRPVRWRDAGAEVGRGVMAGSLAPAACPAFTADSESTAGSFRCDRPGSVPARLAGKRLPARLKATTLRPLCSRPPAMTVTGK